MVLCPSLVRGQYLSYCPLTTYFIVSLLPLEGGPETVSIIQSVLIYEKNSQ